MVPGERAVRLPHVAAPRARGDGPDPVARVDDLQACSPRTRGWSQVVGVSVVDDDLLPAHAGMVPRGRVPRLFCRTAPRARGDGPPGPGSTIPSRCCSPRTRGWSPRSLGFVSSSTLLPAHAGMVLRRGCRTARRPAAPRARGDGPGMYAIRITTAPCSPRTRGRLQREVGFPALPCLFKGDRL